MATKTTKGNPVAVEKGIEDPSTGAQVVIHSVRTYTVDLASKTTTAVLSSFASKAMFAAGRSPVSHIGVNLPGTPAEGEDHLQWIYTQIGLLEQGDLAGASAVFAE